MSRSYRLAAVAALLVFSGARTAAAQSTANASVFATAFVSGIAPLTASGVHDLDFGTVNAGSTKGPTSMSADAGRFNISGQPSSPVTVSFVLPAVLTGAGSSTIPISFGGSDGLRWNVYPASFTTFNPNAPFLTSLDASGNLTVGISGTVAPPTGTTTGNYTGTITLTVAY